MAGLFEKDGRHQTKGLNRFPPFRAVSGLLDGLTFGLLDFGGKRTGKNSIIGAVNYKRGILGASFGNFARGAVIGALVLGAIALTGGLAAVPLLGGLGVVGGALAVGAANATLGVARHGVEMAANVISAPFVLTAKLFRGVKNMLGFGGGQQMAQGMGRSAIASPGAGAGQESIMGKLIGAAAATIAAKMGVDSFMGALADKVSGIFGSKSAESGNRSATSGERASQSASGQSASNNAPKASGVLQGKERVRAAQQWADNWGGVGLEGDDKKAAVSEVKDAVGRLGQLPADDKGNFVFTDRQLENPQCQKDIQTLANAMKRELDFLSKSPNPAHQELFLKRSEEIAKAAAHPVPDANGNISVSPYALLARANPNDPNSPSLADNLVTRGENVAQNRADAIQRARETVGLDSQQQPAVTVETTVAAPQPEAPANGADKQQGSMSAQDRAKAVIQDLDAIFSGLPDAAQMNNKPAPDRASIGSALLNAGVSHSGSADRAAAGHGTGKTEADIRASRTQATPN